MAEGDSEKRNQSPRGVSVAGFLSQLSEDGGRFTVQVCNQALGSVGNQMCGHQYPRSCELTSPGKKFQHPTIRARDSQAVLEVSVGVQGATGSVAEHWLV